MRISELKPLSEETHHSVGGREYSERDRSVMFGLLEVDDDNSQTPTKAPLDHKLCLMSTEIFNHSFVSQGAKVLPEAGPNDQTEVCSVCQL